MTPELRAVLDSGHYQMHRTTPYGTGRPQGVILTPGQWATLTQAIQAQSGTANPSPAAHHGPST